ncbi:unnamed protein product [marine sediment metagenome]|uniref:Replication protein n=1 Tax=marine sediment metagenome TaxID=412755 RepID=X1PXX1_9ZZZZ
MSETPILLSRDLDKLIEKAAIPAPCPTSVHTEETLCTPPPQRTYGEELRSHFPKEWPATADAYSAWDSDDGGSRLVRLEQCRSFAWFMQHTELHTVKVMSSACHLRWCPLDAQALANYRSHSVADWYSTCKSAKLLTLTQCHSDEPLEDQRNRLYKSFAKLMRCKYMRSRIRGYIWFFQYTLNKQTKQFHFHIHALLDADFIPKAEISTRWAKYNQGSYIVNIKGCWSAASAANHVGRYATRPGTLSSIPLDRRLELVKSMHGRRIVGACRSAKSVSLSPPKATDKDMWRYLGSYEQVQRQRAYNDSAKAIVLAWKLGITVPADIHLEDEHSYEVDQPFLKDAQGNDYYSQSMFNT